MKRLLYRCFNCGTVNEVEHDGDFMSCFKCGSSIEDCPHNEECPYGTFCTSWWDDGTPTHECEVKAVLDSPQFQNQILIRIQKDSNFELVDGGEQ